MHYKQHIKNLLKNNKDGLYRTNTNKTAIALIDLFDEAMARFDYQSTTDLTYFFDMFDILVDLLKDNKPMQIQFYNKFTYIHNTMKTLLHAKPKEESKRVLKNFRILKNLMNKMENTMLRIYFDNPAEYDPNKEEFIYYIVFKLKNINFFSATCEKFPHIVNSVDKEGIPLIEKVLDSYLNALDLYLSKPNLGPLDDLIYYDKVISTIMASKKININDYTKKLMLDKIKHFYESKNFFSNRHKEKLSFFINSIIDIITGEEPNNSIAYLNYKYEIHDKFKEAHNLEAKRIYIQHSKVPAPTTPRKIYTFDGENAKEIDDGVSMIYEDGIYHLGIHIANPSMYIPSNSILMDEASRRTTSIYMNNDCIPLYPFLLSADLMSMNQNKNTYCMSYYYDIDALSGELINFEIKSEICRIEKNLTYDYFNKCLDKGTKDADFFFTLVNLSNVSEIMKRVYNEDVVYEKLRERNTHGLAESIIANAMIYNNYHVAKYFHEHDLPFIYRCHELNESDKTKLSELQERLKLREHTTSIIQDIELLKNLYPRAYSSSRNVGHFGLGVDYYCHITSPLRRLHDNLAIMCINRFILNPYTNDDKKRMLEIIDEQAEIINAKRASIEDYEIQYMKLKYQNHQGK